jgi:choline dehydrogenase-like flavoprotein
MKPALVQSSKDFEPDVVIVGSGASGGMTAYVLTQAGIKVLMLEAGRHYDPTTETPMLNWEREAPLAGVGTPDKPFGFYDATIDGGWEVPGEPYTMAPGSKFKWWRARMLGGRTNHWARHVPRFGPYDFKPYSRDGLGVDWPVSYDDVAPYYDKVEQLIGVHGKTSGLENQPGSNYFLPPPKPRIPELLYAAAAKSLNIPCVESPRAILTRDMPHPHAPRSKCFFASPCGRGCQIGAAFQTPTSLLPMAMGTGNLRIVTDAMAHAVKTDKHGRATGVLYFDKKTGKEHLAKARVVVLAASACESARLLLNSGIGNSSGQVGRNLMDSTGTDLAAHVPALEGRPRYNEDGNSQEHLFIPWWLYQQQKSGQLDFPRGYHFEIGGGFNMPDGDFGLGGNEDGYGARLKEDARRYYGAVVWISLRGEMVPNADSYCEIDPGVRDRYGIPVLRFHWKWSDHEIRQIAHGQKTAKALFDKMGARVLTPDRPPEQAIADGGVIIHEVGTTRMGDKPSNSVVNQYCQSWDVPNLFVVDGGVMASQAHKNPTLTILALSWRGTDHMVEKMQKHEI